MSNYVPLQIKTHYSLLHSTITPSRLADFLAEKNIHAAAITDYGTISGCIQFYKALKEKKIKPILGCTLYVCDGPSTDKSPENKPLSYLTVLCKNLAAWKELIKIVSYSNHPDRFDEKPRLSLDELATFDLSNFICITGGQASVLANEIFQDRGMAYNVTVKVEDYVKPDYQIGLLAKGVKIKEMFDSNIYLQITHSDYDAARLLNETWRKCLSKKVAAPNVHYLRPEDATDQRVLLCTYLKKELKDVASCVITQDEHTLGQFFLSDEFFLPTELGQPYSDDEIVATLEIANQCEEYDILSKPRLPKFKCPDGLNEDEYLRQLCRDGWKKRIASKIKKENQQVYIDRVKSELDVLQGAGLSPYLLILADILNWSREQGYLCGPGRGSAAGCLTTYLSNITAIDPIKHGLYFERFYNAGRNTADHVAMPDIDFDVPMGGRDNVIQYIKERYGEENVYQMITYQNLKGRSALKEVLRAYGGISYTEMNAITEPIPQEQAIAGELQEMKEDEGESSIIRWTLENRGDQLKDWCYIEGGELKGPLSKRFEQAIRLEGIRKAQSKHAAGIVISPEPFHTMCPLVYDKSTDGMAGGYEMNDMEAIGLVKFDCLGISSLDRIMGTAKILVNEGEL